MGVSGTAIKISNPVPGELLWEHDFQLQHTENTSNGIMMARSETCCAVFSREWVEGPPPAFLPHTGAVLRGVGKYWG